MEVDSGPRACPGCTIGASKLTVLGCCQSPSSFPRHLRSPGLRVPGACLLPWETALGTSHLCSLGLSLLICIMASCSQAVRRRQLSPQSLEFSLSHQCTHLLPGPLSSIRACRGIRIMFWRIYRLNCLASFPHVMKQNGSSGKRCHVFNPLPPSEETRLHETQEPDGLDWNPELPLTTGSCWTVFLSAEPQCLHP